MTKEVRAVQRTKTPWYLTRSAPSSKLRCECTAELRERRRAVPRYNRRVIALLIALAAQTDPIAAPAPASAAVVAPAPPVAVDAQKALKRDAGPKRILVLEPTSASVKPETLATIASLLSVEIGKLNDVEVISSADVRKLSGLQADKAEAGCDDSGCLAELAGAIDAELVVFGDAGTLGSLTILNISVFEAATAKSVSRVSLRVESLEKLPDQIVAAVPQLFPSAGDAPSTASGGAPLWWTLSLVGGGVVIGALGLAFDGFSSSSADGTFDGLDTVGPLAYVVGGSAIAVGLFVNPFAEAADAP